MVTGIYDVNLAAIGRSVAWRGGMGARRRSFAMAALAIGLTMAVAPAWAALAPNVERLREMRSILDSPDVQAAFDVRRPLEGLQYVGDDQYVATGGGCRLALRIVSRSMPQGMVGPRQFAVRAGRLACR